MFNVRYGGTVTVERRQMLRRFKSGGCGEGGTSVVAQTGSKNVPEG